MTGASGVIGTRIVRRLLKTYRVRVLTRRDYFEDPNISVFNGDIMDESDNCTDREREFEPDSNVNQDAQYAEAESIERGQCERRSDHGTDTFGTLNRNVALGQGLLKLVSDFTGCLKRRPNREILNRLVIDCPSFALNNHVAQTDL